MIQQLCSLGFPIRIQLVGGHFRQNDQKLDENYKINIFRAKQWEDMEGTSQFWGEWGDPASRPPPSPPVLPTRGNPVILMAEIKKQLDFEYLTLFLLSMSFKEFL